MRIRNLSTVLVAATIAGGIGLSAYGVTALHAPSPPAPQAASLRPHLDVRPSGATVSASPPVRIEVPAIGVSSELGPARGLTASGHVDDAPISGPIWALPWWYDRGASPGQPGSAVILGHVDSAVGAGHLGVFFRLAQLKPGDAIDVQLADGAVTRWRVVSDAMYPDTHFPDATVYSRSGPPTLRLVTCGGAYNWSTHLYESAVVVTAALTKVTSAS